MRLLTILLLLWCGLPLLGAQLSSFEKGKKSKEQVDSGTIISFKDGTLTFRTSFDTRGSRGGLLGQIDISLPASKYQMEIIVDDNPIRGSVDNDNHTIPMSYPTETKDTDHQRADYETKDKNKKPSEPEERDLTTCHDRGKDWLVPKDADAITGTIVGISVAGQAGYVLFQVPNAKAPQRYRFDELSRIGIGRCP